LPSYKCHIHRNIVACINVFVVEIKGKSLSYADAELLFEVELMDFVDNSAVEALQNLSLDDNKNFDTILKAAQAEHLAGNQLFKKDEITGAISK
jgi:hypothetical protein